MKTKFSIEIHGTGNFNDSIVRMITNHNEGLVDISFSTISGFIYGKYAEFPTITPITTMNTSYPKGTMEIIEKGKHTITITKKEVHELKEEAEEAPTLFLQSNPNDIVDITDEERGKIKVDEENARTLHY